MAPSGDDSFYTKLSNFEIEKNVKGQFSIVYRARCPANDKVVALKKNPGKYEVIFVSCSPS